jgi:hypothetical protein
MAVADFVRAGQDVLDGRVFQAARAISKGVRTSERAGADAVGNAELQAALYGLRAGVDLGFSQTKLAMIVAAPVPAAPGAVWRGGCSLHPRTV